MYTRVYTGYGFRPLARSTPRGKTWHVRQYGVEGSEETERLGLQIEGFTLLPCSIPSISVGRPTVDLWRDAIVTIDPFTRHARSPLSAWPYGLHKETEMSCQNELFLVE